MLNLTSPLEKTTKLLFFLALTCSLLSSIEGYSRETKASLRIGGFIPQSSLFREVYGSVIPEYQLELSTPLLKSWQSWGNISFLCASGKSDPLHNSCNLWMLPISLGIKRQLLLPSYWTADAGIGLSYLIIDEKNRHSPCDFHHRKHSVGAIFKLEFERVMAQKFFGFFFDYRVHYASISHNNVNLSGLSAGGKVGVTF